MPRSSRYGLALDQMRLATARCQVLKGLRKPMLVRTSRADKTRNSAKDARVHIHLA